MPCKFGYSEKFGKTLRQQHQYMILPYWYMIIIIIAGFVMILLSAQSCIAQNKNDHSDSVSKQFIDSGLTSLKTSLIFQEHQITGLFLHQDSLKKKLKALKPSLNKDSFLRSQLNPYENIFKLSSPFFHFDGGYLAYNYNYHSSTDTPYAESNISQSMVNASMNFSIEKYLPFIANAYISRSNSQYFRNITDVQVVFNAAAFKNQFAASLKQMYASLTDSLKSSHLEDAYVRARQRFVAARGWLQNPFQLQKLIQANETLHIPRKSYDPSLSDSANAKKTDSLQSEARTFIKEYGEEKSKIDALDHVQDSLGNRLVHLKSMIARYKSVLTGEPQNSSALDGLEDSLRRYGVKNLGMPEHMNWLLGVQNFSVGKTPVNYTELTVKNISVTGINFEYNNLKYYYAFCGGLLDYRFNDPVVNSSNKVNQYMYMFRAGLGNVNSNHFILSFYQGKKQLFTAASSASLGSIPISGISAEARLNISSHSYLVAEVAESFAPDYHYSPTKPSDGLNISDKTNKAIVLKAYESIPSIGTGVEGMYKYTGSNFQSFSFFQTNTALKSWYIKADQLFFKRKLRLSVAAKTSDFSNPYIVQKYNSNTVFTSINASFRSRHFPSISIGYMPMSQLTAVGSQIVENKFQTLTANINHYYKIGSIQASSTAVLTKFYNNGSDTSFIFYNATNILGQQNFFFRDFTGNINFSRSSGARYVLNVVGEEVDFPISKKGSIGIGFKLNNYNKAENKVGQVFNFNYQIGTMDFVSIIVERGYLPGSAGLLVHNDFGNIQFIKRFK